MAWNTSPCRFSNAGGRAKSRNVWSDRSNRVVSASKTTRSRSVRPLAGFAFHGILDEHFHGRERIAQFMGHAGSELPKGGHLFAAQHLDLALLQAIDDCADLVGHGVQNHVQVFDSGGRDEIDRSDHFFEFAAGCADGHVKFHDGTGHAAGDPVAGDHACRSAKDAEPPKEDRHPRRHALIIVTALADSASPPGRATPWPGPARRAGPNHCSVARRPA